MHKPKDRRKKVFANRLHKQVFLLIVLAALVPALMLVICLYYLIFGITAIQLGIPEAIVHNIIPATQKVTLILAIAAPFAVAALILLARRMTHRILGPFERIVKELDEHIEGKRGGHIIIRKKDEFKPLLERINKLLDRVKKD